QVYKKRWYMLFMFSAFAGIQALVWIFWGPIAATTEHAFGWKDSDIAFFNNWGPITFIPMALPLAWLTDRKGLRPTVITGMVLVTVGSGIKCITTNPDYILWITHIGQALNGMAGPIAMGTTTTVSAVWFPPDQRATATSIMYSSQSFLIAISFILGKGYSPLGFSRLKSTFLLVDICILVFGICGVILITMVLHFPSKPKHPPSNSASKIRLDYIAGMKQLIRNRQFWLVALIYGTSTGTRDAWSSMLDVNFKAHHVSQVQVGWIGFVSAMAAVISTIIIARFADIYKRKMKLFLIFLFISTTVMYVWLVLTLLDILTFNTKSLFASNVLASLLNGATSPIFYELCCEITYPVDECITSVILTLPSSIASLISLGTILRTEDW
ncbi:hypothetical protein LOTGIDRAFT_119290, partial [Lottia gigantea]